MTTPEAPAVMKACREAFEREYCSGDDFSDAISLARREDGEYEQALARLCFKWFTKGVSYDV